ncbi:MAG: zinc ribbon domain-containing protein [Gemmatimonadota bacterium]|nr:zinc ribbon domain-containing protein [Gemmatimonadota bacterium]
MSDTATMCPGCGLEADGNFCSACGTALHGPRHCTSCGSGLATGAMYCAECGSPVSVRAVKPASARLPWILAAVALAAFSLVIAVLVQRGSVARVGDMTVTGGLPGTPGGSGAPATGGPGMPSLEELNAMTPRQAADRLYERAMTELESGDFERSAFFLDMGLQAYTAVPPEDMDSDARFHMGLMQMHLGDSASARRTADLILDEEPEHLLGLILAARVAALAGDAETERVMRDRIDAVIEEAGGIPDDREEYRSHRPLIERELEGG